MAVVGLAKSLTPTVEAGSGLARRAESGVGIIIAAVVLLPECLAALRAAQANRLQTSLNLALGSALASNRPDDPRGCASFRSCLASPSSSGWTTRTRLLLALTLLLSVITLGTGRTTVLQGVVIWSSSQCSCSSRWCLEAKGPECRAQAT